MIDFERPLDDPTPPGDPAGCDRELAREFEELVRQANRFISAWRSRYPDARWEDPAFTQVYQGLARTHPIARVLEVMRARETDGALSRADQPNGDLSIPVSPEDPGLLGSLGLAFRQAHLQVEQGQIPDHEPIQRVLAFGNELLDHPDLLPFQADFLGQFPTSVLPATERGGLSPTEKRLPVGYVFGPYRVVRLLGTGGFAEVYLVEHQSLKEWRAAKAYVTLPAQGPDAERVQKAFYDEAQIQVRLKHPHIVTVHDVVTASGYLILILEYVEGRSLRALIDERNAQERHLSPVEIIEIGIAVAQALSYAHGQGILHRDIKPENVLLGSGGAIKVSDFGLARPLNETGQRRTTRLGRLIGSPHYMAPEQFTEDVYGASVDLYSLGACLYHCAYGEPPFDAPEVWGILDQHRSEPPKPLSLLLQGFPKSLDRIILRCLEKNPKDRFSSSEELERALTECRAQIESAGPAPRARRFAKAVKRTLNRRLGGAIAILLLSAVALVLGVERPASPAKGPAANFSSLSGAPALPRGESTPAQVKRTEGSERPSVSETPESRLASVPVSALHAPAPPRAPAPLAPSGSLPPATKLREKLSQGPLSAVAQSTLASLSRLVEAYQPKLAHRSYDELLLELDLLAQDRATRADSDATIHLRAARRMVEAARNLVEARLDEIRTAREAVSIRLADGRVLTGRIENARHSEVTVRDPRGSASIVPFPSLAPEEFITSGSLPESQLAYQGLSMGAARTLPLLLELESSDESVLLWTPLLLRLSLIQIREEASRAAHEVLRREQSPTLTQQSAESQKCVVADVDALARSESRLVPLYSFIEGDFKAAGREKEALDLLISRKWSAVCASFRETASAPVAADLVRSRFEGELEKGWEELILGPGYWNNRWRLTPAVPEVGERLRILVVDAGENSLALEASDHPRTLSMTGTETCVQKGLRIRTRFQALGSSSEDARWEFLLEGDPAGTVLLRVGSTRISIERRVLEPGAPDRRLLEAPLPPSSDPNVVRTILLVPFDQAFHLFVDGESVFCLPLKEARIPRQLAITVTRGRLTIRELRAPGSAASQPRK